MRGQIGDNYGKIVVVISGDEYNFLVSNCETNMGNFRKTNQELNEKFGKIKEDFSKVFEKSLLISNTQA